MITYQYSSHCLPESFTYFNLFQLNHIPNYVGKFTVYLDRFSSSGLQDISILFFELFPSVYTTSTTTTKANLPRLCYDLSNNCLFSIVDIEVGLDKLTNVNSAGPDGLPRTYLFNLRYFLSVPLLLIFRHSLNEEVFASIWKLSSITPIHKSLIW